jgi:glycerate dehydrogenase
MAKIVVLDGFTLNPGDLSWNGLAELGDVEIYDRSSPAEAASRIRGAAIIITNKVPVTEKMMEENPQLEGIVVMATGTNIVDLEAAKFRNIPVLNAVGYSTPSVVQLVFGLIFHIRLRLDLLDNSVKSGRWSAGPDFCYWLEPISELAGKTLGIFGYGMIGKAVGEVAKSFGMHLLTIGRNQQEEIEKMFSESDIITLHAPLTADTKEIVNRNLLEIMQPHAILINTGRGGLIQEHDLNEALLNRVIYAAGLDVLSTEPPSPEHPLLSNPYCVITPHVAWTGIESRKRLLEITIENVKKLLSKRLYLQSFLKN